MAAAAAVAVVFAVAPWNAPAGEADAPVADAPTLQEPLPADDVPEAEPEPAAPDDVPAPESVVPPTDVIAPAPAPAPPPAPAPVPPTEPVVVAPAPTPTPTPTPEVPPPALTAAPILAPVAALDAPTLDPFTGTGVPGATIALIDERGATLVETTVQPDAQFTAEIPADLLREGLTVRAVQTAPGLLASEPSAAVGPFALPAPTVTTADGTLQGTLTDADGDGAADDLPLLLDGRAGWRAVVSVDGRSTGNMHVLTGTPLSRVVYDTTPGDHVIGIRYIDHQTGRLGRLATFTIVAVAPAG